MSKLASCCGLSRSTILYYESVGLLRASARTAAGYRSYGAAELARLKVICTYRSAGLKIKDIRELLGQPRGGAASVLHRRLAEISAEIEKLRLHQQSIVKLLRTTETLRSRKDMTKQKWVSIMKSAGFSEQDMHRWHAVFETTAPEDHQEFLEYLHIAPDEIAAIREWSGQQGRAPE